MTISITDSACTYTGDGSTTTFEVKNGSNGIYFETASELTVTLRSADTITTQTISTHYTVSGAGSAAGSITFLTAPASGVEIRIERNTPLTQTLSLTQAGAFSPSAIMGALDKNVRAMQDLRRIAGGSGPGTYNSTPMTLDPSGDEWDADSKKIGNVASATESDQAVNYGQLQSVLATAGAGDVVGPASATDDRIATFDGATGKIIQDGGKTIAEVEAAAAAAALTAVRDGVSASFDTLAELASGKAPATSGTSVLKGDGSGGTTAAAATDLGAGKHTLWIPAAAMTARTTNGAASGTTELATNDIMLRSFDFDTTTEEGVGFMIAMPKSWNESTVTFKAFWTAASGSGGVAWGLAGYALSDDDAMDTAVSGQQIVTDTLITANDMHITSESSAITIGGSPAEGDVVYFEITREVANGSDTIAADAKLIGIHLYITTNAITDA